MSGTTDLARAARVAPVRLTRGLALFSLVVVALSYVVNAMDRQVFPVLLPHVRTEFGFSLSQGGWLATVFTLGIGLAGIPTGFLLDRLSRKTVMLLGIGLYSAFTVLTALAVGYGDMFVYRALSGVGEAMQNAALFSAVGAYFFASRALAIGSLNFAYGLGGFLGPQVGAHLAGSTGEWRTALWAYGAVGFLFVVLIAVLVRRGFTEQAEVKTEDGAVVRPDVDHLPRTLLNRNTLLLAVAAAAVGLAMYGYIGLYPTFLQEELGLSQGQAGLAASMFGLGALVGLPAGFLGDRLNQRWLLITAMVVGCVVGWLIFNGPESAGAQYALSFGEGALASGFCFVNIYSALQRSVHPDLIGRASGVFVSSFYVPAAFAGTLFAHLVDSAGWGGAGFWQLAVLPLLGVAAMLLVDMRRQARVRTVLAH